MKPRLKIVAGRPVTIAAASPAVEAARQRFSLNTGEPSRRFIHEQGTRFQRYPEHVLSRWLRKADFLNVKRNGEAA